MLRALATSMTARRAVNGPNARRPLRQDGPSDGSRVRRLRHGEGRRLGETDDIAIAALYLASPASIFVTGKVLRSVAASKPNLDMGLLTSESRRAGREWSSVLAANRCLIGSSAVLAALQQHRHSRLVLPPRGPAPFHPTGAFV